MNRKLRAFVGLLIACLWTAVAPVAQAQTLALSTTLARPVPPLSIITTRLGSADGTVGNTQVMSRTYLVATDNIQRRVQVGVCGCWISSSSTNANEVGNGAIVHVQMALEQPGQPSSKLLTFSNYPCAVGDTPYYGDETWACTQAIPVSPGGATTQTGGVVISDPIDLPVMTTNGSSLFVRMYQASSAGLMTYGAQDTTDGDRFSGATGTTAPAGNVVTGVGSFTSTSTTNMMPIFLFVAPSNATTVGIFTDSLGWGTDDTDTIDVRKGSVQRSLPTNIATLNFSTPSTQVRLITAATLSRSVGFKYVNNFVNQGGVNDLIKKNTATSAQFIGYMQTAISLGRVGARWFDTAITPVSTDTTTGFTTLIGQTASTGSGDAAPGSRVNWNTDCRGGVAGFYACFDIASSVESSLNSGLWSVTGVSTANDINWATGTRNVTSASPHWTSADVGKPLRLDTAGAGLTPYVGQIGTFTSSTAVSMSSLNPTFTTSGTGFVGLAEWGMLPNPDGVHLMPFGYGTVVPASGVIINSLFRNGP